MGIAMCLGCRFPLTPEGGGPRAVWVELHVWLCPDRFLAENSSCLIQVTDIEAPTGSINPKDCLRPMRR